MASSYALVELGLSSEAYEEIKQALIAAGYNHVFMSTGMIDMSGIGVTTK